MVLFESSPIKLPHQDNEVFLTRKTWPIKFFSVLTSVHHGSSKMAGLCLWSSFVITLMHLQTVCLCCQRWRESQSCDPSIGIKRLVRTNSGLCRCVVNEVGWWQNEQNCDVNCGCAHCKRKKFKVQTWKKHFQTMESCCSEQPAQFNSSQDGHSN